MGANCVTSASIGCLFCCQGCNAEKLRNAFAFLPPPPSYTVQDCTDLKDNGGGAVGSSPGPCSSAGRIVYATEALKAYSFYQQAADHAEVRFLRTSHGERIPVVWMRPSGSSSSAATPSSEQPMVLLHCHGNATDIGMMMGPYFELSKQLGIEVVGVEYTGYGASSGTPSARTTHTDIEAAYNFIVDSGVPPERIIAYGQSVGSGPVVGLASRRQLGGIVLHSPMLSGIKVIDPQPSQCCRPSCVFRCFDFFPNDKFMRKLDCLGFVIHGKVDDIIPFYHGANLAEVTPAQNRWPGYFPRLAGHNDIVEQNAKAYFAEVGAFVRAVEHRAKTGEQTLKPTQVEMITQKPMAEPIASLVPPPRQDHIENGRGNDSSLPYREPVVGPEDGRYAALRHGAGGARELQVAPDAQPT